MLKAVKLLILFLAVSVSLFSQNTPLLAPLNPDFVTFLEQLKSGKAPLPGSEEFGTGGMPPPAVINFDSYLKNSKLKSTDFDPVYDMRTTGLLTPVRGQTSNGCWAFATIGSVESQWLKLGQGAWDLSENNLKFCHGFDYDRSFYGNHFMSTAYFARRAGPLAETDDPNSAGSLCPADKTPVAYITDARYLPNDRNTVKQAILDHGAIYTMMNINGNYYNTTNYTYYSSITAAVNHAVDIVGWDDGKVTAAALPGAWICKNSYGAGWGEAGYFYISYYDVNTLEYNAYWPVRNDYIAEDFVYGYDKLGSYRTLGYDTNVGYMLVKFVAADPHTLSKVGTYAMASDENIEIDIFADFNPITRTLSGLLSHKDAVLCALPGYYTIDLTTPVSVQPGDDFYIRVKYHTPGVDYQIPVEKQIDDYSYPEIESGVAWISSNGNDGSWYLIGGSNNDFSPYYKGDPCVKVYAEPWVSWSGNLSSDWNTPGNWSKGEVPDELLDIVIPDTINDPVISQEVTNPATCNNLIIQSGAILTVAPGKALTVNGTLTNNSGHTGLIIESDASLITKGKITGTATVKRTVTGTEWHLVSAPVSNAVSGTFTGQYLQKHDESTNQYEYIITVSEALEPLKGYALWTVGDYTANFSGLLNTGLTSFPLFRSSADVTNNGWNLTGNPYPSSIDWDAASGWDKFNVNSTIYRLTDNQWATYISGTGEVPGDGTNGGTRYIAPGQGFFVSVADVGEGTLAMDDRVRVHNTAAFFKRSDTYSLVRLQVSGNGFTDEALVRFLPQATNDFDGDCDALKLFGYNNQSAQIYTLGNTPLAINSVLPETEKIPLGIRASTTGNYTIAATQISNIDEVTLEDTKTGVYTNLNMEPYTFILKSGENEQRFNLHFNTQIFTGTDKTENQAAVVYSFDKTVNIKLNNQLTGSIMIYNVAGQLVAEKTTAQGINSILIPKTGIYMVKVVTAGSTVVRKVWIN